MIRLIIDNQDFTEDADLKAVPVSIGLNRSTGSFAVNNSLDVSLIGAGAAYVKENLVDVVCEYPTPELAVKLVTDCGTLDFCIDPNQITSCTDCSMVIGLTSGNDEEVCYNRLKNQKYLNVDFWKKAINEKTYGILPYSIDVSAFIVAVIKVIDLITTPLQALLRLFGDTSRKTWILYGTGRWHPVFKISYIMDYYAKLCGKTFKSSILDQTPYDRMYMLSECTDRGFFIDNPEIVRGLSIDPNGLYDPFNLPIALAFVERYNTRYTVSAILDELATAFAAEWRISQDSVLLETPRTFRNNALYLGRLEDFVPNLCVNPIVSECAKFSYEYSLDNVDTAGDTDRSFFNTDYDVPNPGKFQTEPCQTKMSTGIAAGSRSEGSNGFVRFLRSSPSGGNFGDMLFFLGKEAIISNHRTSIPKFVINDAGWEGTRFVVMEATPHTDEEGEAFRVYNEALSFRGGLAKYQETIRPESGAIACYEWPSYDICYNCELVNQMIEAFADGRNCYFDSDFGQAHFREADVVFGETPTLTIKNLKFYQK